MSADQQRTRYQSSEAAETEARETMERSPLYFVVAVEPDMEDSEHTGAIGVSVTCIVKEWATQKQKAMGELAASSAMYAAAKNIQRKTAEAVRKAFGLPPDDEG